jgi:hypothetical protein
MHFVILPALFIFIGLPGTVGAQEHIDTFYFKIEPIIQQNVRIGSRVIYIDASEMYSSDSREFVVEYETILCDNTRKVACPGLAEGLRYVSILPGMDRNAIDIQAPYWIDAIKITDTHGNIFFREQNIKSEIFTVNIAAIKAGFYTLEISAFFRQ